MQNKFLIVICKLIAMFMVIAAENVRATVNVSENIHNYPVHFNSTNRTIMEYTAVSTNSEHCPKALPLIFDKRHSRYRPCPSCRKHNQLAIAVEDYRSSHGSFDAITK